MTVSFPQPEFLNAFDELTCAISRPLDLEEIEAEYIRLIHPLIPAQSSALYLFRPNDSNPIRIAGKGVDVDFLDYYERDGREIDPLHNWIRQNYTPNQSHRLLGLTGWQSHPVYRVVGTLSIDYAMQSPIVIGDEVIGTINFGRPKKDGRFTNAELKTASILCRFLSIAVARAIDYDDFRLPQKQLRQAMERVEHGVVIADSNDDIRYVNHKAWTLANKKFGTERALGKLTYLVQQGRSEANEISDVLSNNNLNCQFCPLPGSDMQRILMLLDEVPTPDFGRLGSVLTDREIEVLRLVERGMQNREIAQALFISVNTVKRHLDNMYNKFDASSRTELIAKVYRLLNILDGGSGGEVLTDET